MTERLWTVEQCADYLAKPPSWVYGNWTRMRMPAIRVGRCVRFRPAEIEEWLDSLKDGSA